MGTSIVDMGTGMWAALGVVAALRQRDATGRAVEVTTALFETALMWMSYHAMGYLASGAVPAGAGLGHRDDRAVSGLPDRRRVRDDRRGVRRPVHAPGGGARLPRAGADARFKDNPSRVNNRAALVEALSPRTRERKAAELVETLRGAGVPAAPILSVDQVLQEPQTRESGVLVARRHPRLPDYRSIGLPLTWDAREAGRAPGPAAARRAQRRRPHLARLHARRRPQPQGQRASSSDAYRHLLVTRSDDERVVTVTMNRPEQMNAMNTAMGEDLLACFDALPARSATCAPSCSPARAIGRSARAAISRSATR